MTTSEMIIAILLLLATIGLCVSIFLANLLNKELNTLINNLYDREEYLVKITSKLEAAQAKRSEASEKFREEILKNIKKKAEKPDINVLDFPNDH